MESNRGELANAVGESVLSRYERIMKNRGDNVGVGIEHGVVEKKGAWLQFSGELIGQGKEAARKALVEKPDLARKITETILARRNAAAAAASGKS